MKKTDILEQCPHLKSEWLPISSPPNMKYYQNAYSEDQSEAKYLKAVPMKQVDIYSSREAYSFPFCPRIYKYVIAQNYQQGNQLSFNLLLLSERVKNRLCENFLLNATNQQIKFLTSKANEIVKGFNYLYKRFGLFEITQKMIGWTELGIVKVWFNQDFTLNKKLNTNVSQQSMVTSLIKILQQNTMLKHRQLKKCTTFQSLLNCLQHPQSRKQSEITKQVGFRPLQNLSATISELYYHLHPTVNQGQKQDNKLGKSGKNITFSYSNKDLKCIPVNDLRNGTKKCSIHMDQQQHKKLLSRLAELNNECKEMDQTPPTSLKTIVSPVEGRTNRKRASHFNVLNIQQKKFNPNELRVEKNTDKYSKTTVSYRNEGILKQYNRVKPQMLTYSTSSNPISRFINLSMGQNKAYSTQGSVHQERGPSRLKKQSCQSNASQISGKQDFKLRLQENFEGLPLKIEQKEEETNMRQSQEIQKDLDALFLSDHQFDYNQLENELDCIL